MKSCLGSSVTELIQLDNGRLGGCLMEGIAVDRPAMVRTKIADDRHGWDGKGLGISLPVWLGVALTAPALGFAGGCAYGLVGVH